MKRNFFFRDEKSDKFWSIEVVDKTFTVTYGKTGTSGTSQTKTFGTADQCRAEADKLIKEKVKKGYSEGEAESSESYLAEWKAICEHQIPADALAGHFNYLADDPAITKIIAGIFKKCKQASVAKDSLQIEFEGGQMLRASKPANLSGYKGWPESFKKLVTRHEVIEFGDKNPSIDRDYILGDHGSFIDDSEDGDFEDAMSPMVDDSSDWWIYHPTKKNKLNQPRLVYVSHEDGQMEDQGFQLNVGSLFILRVAKSLNIAADGPFWGESDDEEDDDD